MAITSRFMRSEMESNTRKKLATTEDAAGTADRIDVIKALAVERLQKILSQAGVASRRASEQLMLDGRVTVNGATIRELGTKADPSRDDIRVDGRRVKLPERHRYL